ncbi:MAG: hypothetical protein V4722_10430 [Bacteroidota bacterium]
MHRAGLFFIVVLVAVIFQRCSTTRQLTSDRKAHEISSLLILQPVAKIGLINKGNKPETNVPFSKKATKEIELQVKNLLPENILVSQLNVDESQDSTIPNAITYIVNEVEKVKTLNRIVVPESLLHFLDSANHDFCLGILEVGFVRSKDNYDKQHDLGNMTQFATLGLYGFVPYKSSSTMVCFIVDRKNRNLAFYRRGTWKETDPTERIVIKAHLDDLISKYFDSAK